MRVARWLETFAAFRGAWALGLILSILSSVQAERLPLRTYTTADGLAQNLVSRIVRDSRGYLWFCTRDGLSRFDGYRFTNYTTDQGLPHRSVTDLLETRSRVYWVATRGGLCRFNPNSSRSRNPAEPMFVVYHPNESLQASFITVLYEDHTGTLWVGTTRGLYRLEETDGQVKFHFVDMGMPTETFDGSLVESIRGDRRGALWVGAQGSGLYRRLPDGSVQRYTTRHGLPDNRINALLEDRDGQLWVGTAHGVCLLVPEPDPYQPVVARVYRRKDFGLSSNWVKALFQSSDGRIWAGTSAGLSEFTPGARGDDPKFRSYARAHGLDHLALMSLAEDRAGNLWIGATGGAMKLARKGFITYTEVGGRTPLNVLSIFETGSGELCFMAVIPDENPFLIRYGEKSLSVIQPNFPKHITNFGNPGWNQYGLQDRAGEWWIPTGQGLCRFPKVSRVEQLAYTRPKAVYTTKNGLIADAVWRIYEDSRGDIWIASFSLTAFGLARWNRATETFYRYTKADGLPSRARPGAFCEDSSGNIWIGMVGALARYTAGRFTLFTAADGLPASGIHALHLDPAGRLWIATDSRGLSRIDDPKADRPSFVTYTTANGLSSNQVWCVTSDQWGRIYAFTGRGLDRLDAASGRVKHYTSTDGLVGDIPTAAFRDRHGALWFATIAGFSKLIPELDSPESLPPILISGLRIVGQRHPISELGETEVPEIRLGPNDDQIQIDFVGLSFGTGEQLRYQYKLEDADADWSAPSDQRSVNYAHLSPGSYRFLVRAVTSDGTTSQSPASFSFTILPPIWQRWWFVTLVALALSALAYAAYRYRVARLLELERVRTRIATDLHDDIGASLSRIAILSEVCKRHVDGAAQKAVPLLSEIADSARTLVDSMRDIVWAINPRHDDLLGVVSRVRQFASGLLEPRNIRWDLRTAPGIEKIKFDPDERRHLLLFLKEAVTNAARHAECRSLSISLTAERQRLVAEVRDDGRGFEGSVPHTAKAAAGHGLRNMEERAAQLRAQFTIESGQGQGTLLRLAIPLRRR